MAFQIQGVEVKAGVTKTIVTIDGVAVTSSQTITEGAKTITTIKNETGDTCSVICADQGVDISVQGYLKPTGTIPKDGDTCTISGYSLCWIDGCSIAETSEGATVFSCTAHGRQPTAD